MQNTADQFKSMIEMIQTTNNIVEKTSRAYIDLFTNVSKLYVDACNHLYKTFEENNPAAAKK